MLSLMVSASEACGHCKNIFNQRTAIEFLRFEVRYPCSSTVIGTLPLIFAALEARHPLQNHLNQQTVVYVPRLDVCYPYSSILTSTLSLIVSTHVFSHAHTQRHTHIHMYIHKNVPEKYTLAHPRTSHMQNVQNQVGWRLVKHNKKCSLALHMTISTLGNHFPMCSGQLSASHDNRHARQWCLCDL